MKILGISAYYHDSAAALIENGIVLAAVQEERFSRIKHDDDFPIQAIAYCLKEAGIALEQLDAIVFYDKPFLKFERIIQTSMDAAPKGWWQFITAMPSWLKQKLFIKDKIKEQLEELGDVDWEKTELLFSKHHLSHAASSFYASSFEEAAILTIDGVGEWATASIAKGSGNKIQTLKEMHFPNSLGLLYSAFTYFLGFKVNSGEYKVMGLAPYAEKENPLVQNYFVKIKEEIVAIYEDGSIHLNPTYFNYTSSFRMIKEAKFEKLFGFVKREDESIIEEKHYCLAMALQLVTEDVILAMAREAKKLCQVEQLCLAGGVALNCVANGRLKEADIFKEIYVQPASGDAGNALGAAWAAYYIHFKKERVFDSNFDQMQWSRLGPAYSNKEIGRAIANFDLVTEELTEDALVNFCASELAEGKTMAWFQGRMEFGPRALGGRSILGNPLLEDTQSKLNLKVKKRESFRPFAPIMLEEDFAHFFGKSYSSPYMLFVHKILPAFRHENTGANPDLIAKINQKRSLLPAITHIDYSARIQTVNEESDALFFKLLGAFKKITGVGALVNTSFNLRGEPIVCSPEDAIRSFLSTEIDLLVMGNQVIKRKNNLNLLKEHVKAKLD
jgi:carbamoyltransferase